jgi:hypothetical protein
MLARCLCARSGLLLWFTSRVDSHKAELGFVGSSGTISLREEHVSADPAFAVSAGFLPFELLVR